MHAPIMLCTWKCIEFEFMLDMLYKAMDGSSSFICTLILHFAFIPFRANYHHFLMNVLGERANVLRCKWMQLMACEGISQYITFMLILQHCIVAIEMHRFEYWLRNNRALGLKDGILIWRQFMSAATTCPDVPYGCSNWTITQFPSRSGISKCPIQLR